MVKERFCKLRLWENGSDINSSLHNYFFNLLSTYYDVEVSPIKPDILFHSVDYSGKEQYRKYEDSNTKKIFYTGENTKPNFEISDGSFTFIKDSNEFNFYLLENYGNSLSSFSHSSEIFLIISK